MVVPYEREAEMGIWGEKPSISSHSLNYACPTIESVIDFLKVINSLGGMWSILATKRKVLYRELTMMSL